MISAAIYLALFAGFKEWVIMGRKPEILSFSSCENIIRLPHGNDLKSPALQPNPIPKAKTPDISVKPGDCLQPVTLTKAMARVTVPNPAISTKPAFNALNPALSLKPFRRVTVPTPVLNANPVARHDTSIHRQGKMVTYTIETNNGHSDAGGGGFSGSGSGNGGGFSGTGDNGFSGAGGYSNKPQDTVIDPKLSHIGNLHIVSITVMLYSDA